VIGLRDQVVDPVRLLLTKDGAIPPVQVLAARRDIGHQRAAFLGEVIRSRFQMGGV